MPFIPLPFRILGRGSKVYILNHSKGEKRCFCTLHSAKIRDGKTHINFSNINSLAPTLNTPFWAPRKKSLCASFPGKERKKRGPHISFFGGIWRFKNGVPNESFSATKSLVYRLLFFPALKKLHRAPFT